MNHNQTTLYSLAEQSFKLQALVGSLNDILMAYFLPFALVLTITHNVVIFLILSKKGPLRSKLGKTVRIYYLALTFGDVSTALSTHLTYFLGKT